MGAPVIHHQNHTDVTISVTDAAGRLGVRVEEVYRLIRSRSIHASKDRFRLWAVCCDCVIEHGGSPRRKKRGANGNG